MENPRLRNNGLYLQRQLQSMDWRTTVAVLLLVLGISVKTVSGGGHPLFSQRIVGGQNSQLGKWPWHAALVYKTSTVCGASLISKNWAVTAAHCVDLRDFSLFKIMGGLLNLAGESPTKQTVEVKNVIIHPSYEGEGKRGDLALLKLANDVIFNTYIQPISLPAPNQVFENGRMCCLVGWGRTTETVQLQSPYTLQEVELPLINFTGCNKMYEDAYNLTFSLMAVTKEMICAGYPEGKKDGCLGDSGGGLVCKESDLWLLVGVVSWGDGCAEPLKPGVYTLVSAFTSWIQETMNADPSSELHITTTTVKATTEKPKAPIVSESNTTTEKVDTSITEKPKVAAQSFTSSVAINESTTSSGRRLQISLSLLVVVIVWTRILDVV